MDAFSHVPFISEFAVSIILRKVVIQINFMRIQITIYLQTCNILFFVFG